MKIFYFLAFLMLCTFNLNANQVKAPNQESFPKNLTDHHAFEKNRGQIKGKEGHSVLFFHKKADMSIFLMPTGIAYQFHDYKKQAKGNNKSGFLSGDDSFDLVNYEVNTYRMDMELVGANPNAKVTSHGKSKDYTNYYHVNEMRVHSYDKIVYENIYPNIDWVIYKSEQGIKYDFVVKPNGDPNQIKFKAKWVEEMTIDASGNLLLKNRMGRVQEKKPISFQQKKGVETSFVLEKNVLSFKLADYNKNEILIIDPDLVWGSYYGGEGSDGVNAVTTDSEGNVYFCGNTYGSDSLASGGFQNTNLASQGGVASAFLVKFNEAGDRIWATYYGGLGGFTGGLSVAVDAQENVYMAGFTYDFNNISFNGFQNNKSGIVDAYIVKFESDGDRLWGTYFGGSGDNLGSGIAVDHEDNVYLTGRTSSYDLPIFNAFQDMLGSDLDLYTDAFLAKFDASGALLWSTYFGGNNSDASFAVTCNNTGDVFMTGRTNSTTNIFLDGHQSTFVGGNEFDAFLAKYNSSGTLQWSTYYGGEDKDLGWGCTTDNLGNVFICGQTKSTTNIASNGFQNSYAPSFLAKFNSNGVRLWGTYYGKNTSSDYNAGRFCATDSDNNVYLAGRTNHTSNISFQGFQNSYGGGSSDAYIVQFDPSGTRLWATYYGGEDNDGIRGMHVDAANQIYVAGTTQSTNNIFFQGFQDTLQSETGFVAKIGCPNPQLVNLATEVCANSSISINPYPIGGTLELLGQGNLTNGIYTAPDVSQNTNVLLRYTTSGNTTCPSTITNFEINVLPNTIASVEVTTNDLVICQNENATFVADIQNAGSSPNIQWFLNNQLILEDSLTFISSTLSNNDVIQCVVKSSNICATPSEIQSDLINLTVNSIPNVSVVFTDLNGGLLVADLGFTSYQWLLEGQPIPGANSSTYIPTSNGTYTLTVTNEFGCENSASTFVGLLSLNKAEIGDISIYPNPNDGRFTLDFGTLIPDDFSIVNVLGKVVLLNSQVRLIEEVDLRDVLAGVYYIIYRRDGMKGVKKLIVR
jgi:hypothetical protein